MTLPTATSAITQRTVATDAPRHLFAKVRRPDSFRPTVTAIVLFGLAATDGTVFHLEIRYIDYTSNIIEGDHLMTSLQDAYLHAFNDYGIEPSDWRELTVEEIASIEAGIG